MQHEIQRRLGPVRRRLSLLKKVPVLSVALRTGCLLAFTLGVLRLATSGWLPAWTAWLALGIAVVAGLGIAWRSRASYVEAASRVDRHYGWQDTITTAWQLGEHSSLSAMQRRVVRRAQPLASRISARSVVPLRVGRRAITDLLLVGLAVALSVCPLPSFEIERAPREPVLPDAAELAIAAPGQPQAIGPEQVEASLEAIRWAAMDGDPSQVSLAITQDHAIVRKYFRSISSRARPSTE